MSTDKQRKDVNGFGIITEQSRLITIGQLVENVVKLTGQRCTSAMIYNYEKHGLIPEPVRTEGGFRLFRLQDIQIVACIKRWQTEGLSLAQIKEKIDSCQYDFDILTSDFVLPSDRKVQILKSAFVVFSKKGYSETTLKDIAEEAGISASAIYQHFRNKEELFLALTDYLSFVPVLDEINKSLSEAKDNSYKDNSYEDIKRSLIKVANAFLNTHKANAEIVRMFVSESRNFPEVGKRYCERLINPVDQLLMRYLSAQKKRGIIRDVNVALATQAFYGIFLNIIVTQFLLSGEGVMDFPKKDRVEKLVDIFLMGVFSPDAEMNQ